MSLPPVRPGSAFDRDRQRGRDFLRRNYDPNAANVNAAHRFVANRVIGFVARRAFNAIADGTAALGSAVIAMASGKRKRSMSYKATSQASTKKRKASTSQSFGRRKTRTERNQLDNKYFDANGVTMNDLSPTGAVGDRARHLTPIPRGDGVTERVGKTIKASAFRIDGDVTRRFSGQAGNTQAPYNPYNTTMFGFALVQAKKTLAALPAWTDVFQTNVPHSAPNLDRTSDYKILWRSKPYDWNVGFPFQGDAFTASAHTASTDTRANRMRIAEYISLKKSKPVVFTSTSTTGTLAEVREGALIFMGCTDVAAQTGAGEAFTLENVNTRLYFDD